MICVYIAKTCKMRANTHICPDERENYIKSAGSEEVKNQRYSVWKLLERAARDTLGLDMKDASFRVDDRGKWTCDKFFFSLSHTRGAVAVAISDGPVGVDTESIEAFEKRIKSDGGFCGALAEKLRVESSDGLGVLKAWTGRESAFKRGGFDCVFGADCKGLPVVWARHGDLLTAVCGGGAAEAAFFTCDCADGEYLKSRRIYPEITE